MFTEEIKIKFDKLFINSQSQTHSWTHAIPILNSVWAGNNTKEKSQKFYLSLSLDSHDVHFNIVMILLNNKTIIFMRKQRSVSKTMNDMFIVNYIALHFGKLGADVTEIS